LIHVAKTDLYPYHHYFAILISGCATPYLSDRRRDIADIFTATIGVGLGGKVRAGPVQTGLLLQADGLGLRGGTFPDVMDKSESWFAPNNLDAELLVIGAEKFDSNNPNTKLRHKDFAAEPIGPFVSRVHDDWLCPSYYTQLDLVVAVGLSVRLGINPGEVLDFILGWAKVDIFNDDLERRKSENGSDCDLSRQAKEAS